ncbi:MAG: hypothetical protein H0X29_08275 [Parachlamydiaceae bacterium]|nr:hypothetical protein [Parachlamydiaceae bacterium]
MSAPLSGQVSETFSYFPLSEDLPKKEEVDSDQEWDRLIVEPYIDYEVFSILDDTKRLLAERSQTLDELHKHINALKAENVIALKEKKELTNVYSLELQFELLRRELSDEVINSKLNILKNLMKEELLQHSKDSLRALELKGWIQAIRDFQNNGNLPFKIKVLTNVVNAASSAATKTSDKITEFSSLLNSKLARLGVYSTLSDWSFGVKDKLNENFQAINPFGIQPKQVEDSEEKDEFN